MKIIPPHVADAEDAMEMYFQLMESYALDAGMALQCRWGSPAMPSGPSPLNQLELYVGREDIAMKKQILLASKLKTGSQMIITSSYHN